MKRNMIKRLDNKNQEKPKLFFWKKYWKDLIMVLNMSECFYYKITVVLNFYWEPIEFKISK